ncbi:hypothetical protein E2C01_027357 [Portunus trituberculatus]|uniref:Uncharacterized protein n=1 Tax=Portunus trituberculatus TaxID=210409 RepID=A0A5B7ELC0_PORTR|nr:hypothetical protein [Portunus trituberculatus]
MEQNTGCSVHVLESTPEAALLYLIRRSHKPTQQEDLQDNKFLSTLCTSQNMNNQWQCQWGIWKCLSCPNNEPSHPNIANLPVISISSKRTKQLNIDVIIDTFAANHQNRHKVLKKHLDLKFLGCLPCSNFYYSSSDCLNFI